MWRSVEQFRQNVRVCHLIDKREREHSHIVLLIRQSLMPRDTVDQGYTIAGATNRWPELWDKRLNTTGKVSDRSG